MFDLLYAPFFWVMGSIGVLIPLVLHLIQSRRTVKVPFSTIRFLKLAQEKSSSRIKMENILLWILRTLLLVILALAFAMPMLRSKGAGTWLGRSPRDVAIVIDASYSMDYNLGRSTVWQKAIDTASAVIDGLGEQDRFCIYVARDHVEPVIEQLSGDREEGLSRLKALEFSQGSSQLAPAVMEANEALAESEVRREREIHIITDTQALPWESFGGGEGLAVAVASEEDADAGDTDTGADEESAEEEPRTSAAMGAWDPAKIDNKRTVFFVSLLGVDTPENMTPVKIKIEPPLVLANYPSKATVRLGHTGPPKGTTVTLEIDEKEVATQSITLANNQTAELVFTIPPLRAGWHQVCVSLPEDNLVLDNNFHAVMCVEDRFPTLCVGAQEDTVFLRAALKAGQSGGGIESDWIEPRAISDDKLSGYACVFLCNGIPLGAAEVSALEKFVDAGGLLAVFPGNAALPGDYQTLTCLPAIPVAIEEVPATKRKQILHWDDKRSAVMESLRLGDSTLSAVARKRLVIDKLEDRGQRIIAHGGDAAFLLGRPVGRGYVLLFTVSADRSWSDFPLSPFYLPVVHQIIEFGAGVGSHPQFVWCTPNLPLSRCLPEATHNTELAAPDGTRVPVRSAVSGTRTVLYVEDLTTAGIYGVTPPDGGTPVPQLAVNMVRRESDLTALDASNLAGRLSVERVEVARDLEQLLTHIQESRIGRTFGEQLLWVVLILAAAEFFLANRMTQESPTLTGKLGLDASGKVPSVAAALEGGDSA